MWDGLASRQRIAAAANAFTERNAPKLALFHHLAESVVGGAKAAFIGVMLLDFRRRRIFILLDEGEHRFFGAEGEFGPAASASALFHRRSGRLSGGGSRRFGAVGL